MAECTHPALATACGHCFKRLVPGLGADAFRDFGGYQLARAQV